MLESSIKALHDSSQRMMRLLKVGPRDEIWWRTIRKEAWLHLKRSARVIWDVWMF